MLKIILGALIYIALKAVIDWFRKEEDLPTPKSYYDGFRRNRWRSYDNDWLYDNDPDDYDYDCRSTSSTLDCECYPTDDGYVCYCRIDSDSDDYDLDDWEDPDSGST